MTDVLELFGESTTKTVDWQMLVDRQQCPFLGRKCIKIRKSAPDISIGTCSVAHGRRKQPMMICPFRLLERRKIFAADAVAASLTRQCRHRYNGIHANNRGERWSLQRHK